MSENAQSSPNRWIPFLAAWPGVGAAIAAVWLAQRVSALEQQVQAGAAPVGDLPADSPKTAPPTTTPQAAEFAPQPAASGPAAPLDPKLVERAWAQAVGRRAGVHCWGSDAGSDSELEQVKLRLRLDASGNVLSATPDPESGPRGPELHACVARIVQMSQFPAPGKLVEGSVTLARPAPP